MPKNVSRPARSHKSSEGLNVPKNTDIVRGLRDGFRTVYEEGVPTTKHTVWFNAAGQRIKKAWLGKEGKVKIAEYSYDEEGPLFSIDEREETNPQGSPRGTAHVSWTFFVHDDKGRVIEARETFPRRGGRHAPAPAYEIVTRSEYDGDNLHSREETAGTTTTRYSHLFTRYVDLPAGDPAGKRRIGVVFEADKPSQVATVYGDPERPHRMSIESIDAEGKLRLEGDYRMKYDKQRNLLLRERVKEVENVLVVRFRERFENIYCE